MVGVSRSSLGVVVCAYFCTCPQPPESPGFASFLSGLVATFAPPDRAGARQLTPHGTRLLPESGSAAANHREPGPFARADTAGDADALASRSQLLAAAAAARAPLPAIPIPAPLGWSMRPTLPAVPVWPPAASMASMPVLAAATVWPPPPSVAPRQVALLCPSAQSALFAPSPRPKKTTETAAAAAAAMQPSLGASNRRPAATADRHRKRGRESDDSSSESATTVESNDDVCMECAEGGTLICCDGCPHAAHPECAGVDLAVLGDDSWFCDDCVFDPPVSYAQPRAPARRSHRAQKSTPAHLPGAQPRSPHTMPAVETASASNPRGTATVVDVARRRPGGSQGRKRDRVWAVLLSNADDCMFCQDQGTLICCDDCPHAAHPECAGVDLDELGDAAWFCDDCSRSTRLGALGHVVVVAPSTGAILSGQSAPMRATLPQWLAEHPLFFKWSDAVRLFESNALEAELTRRESAATPGNPAAPAVAAGSFAAVTGTAATQLTRAQPPAH